MSQLGKLEAILDERLNKKAPVKLSEGNRKSLAGAMWWLALIAGVLQLYLAWRLWDTWRLVEKLSDYLGSYAAVYGTDVDTGGLGFLFYLSLVTLLASGALLLLAAPGLKAMKKAGWNFVFYSLLVNLLYGVVVLVSDYGDFGNLLGAALGSLVGAYLLFQIRDRFVKSHAVQKKA
jgi:hypothetical protein